jgi:hypothetical protein
MAGRPGTRHYLTASGTEHVVLERGRVGETWRTRGGPGDGTVLRSSRRTGRSRCHDIPTTATIPVASCGARKSLSIENATRPLPRHQFRDGIEVTKLEPIGGGDFRLHLNGDVFEAGQVVVATWAFQRPHRVADERDPKHSFHLGEHSPGSLEGDLRGDWGLQQTLARCADLHPDSTCRGSGLARRLAQMAGIPTRRL